MNQSRAPIDVPDNAQRREVLIVDQWGSPLVTREPRSVGFRPPKPLPGVQKLVDADDGGPEVEAERFGMGPPGPRRLKGESPMVFATPRPDTEPVEALPLSADDRRVQAGLPPLREALAPDRDLPDWRTDAELVRLKRDEWLAAARRLA